MAVCNTFSKLSKETGTFLTFSQYMEDLTAWKTESKYHKIVPSKFIAVDCKPINYTNISLPKMLQECFENACACFKNSKNLTAQDDIDNMIELDWAPEYSKILFWNAMLGDYEFKTNDQNAIQAIPKNNGLIQMSDIKYIGDINLQSYNTVDGMGYSEIYCHIPNEAAAYSYSLNLKQYPVQYSITKEQGDVIEGFNREDMGGWCKLSTKEHYVYSLDKEYEFSWDDEKQLSNKLEDKSFNINMIIVLYDIWNDNQIVCKGIPMGIYLTGLIDDNGNIQNSITKYVSNEDIYNSGTSYGLRICSRYVVSEGTDNYIVKDVTVEDNNYSDLSRVLSQLSISQSKMDEVINKTYNTEQNYKNLLAIFKNSRTNVPYIKIVNNESCWFVNGKLIGPSVVDGVYDAYTNDEIDYLLDSKISQSFQIMATVQDQDGKSVFEISPNTKKLTLKWDTYYEGRKVQPNYLGISDDGDIFKDYTSTNQIIMDAKETTHFTFWAKYGQLEHRTTITVYFVYPIFFGELSCKDETKPQVNPHSTRNNHELDNNNPGFQLDPEIYKDQTLDFDWVTAENIVKLPKYTKNTPEGNFEITTNAAEPGHIVYAYPATYPALRYINDYDGYLYYNSDLSPNDSQNAFVCFKRTLEPIEGMGTQEYYVYINKEPIYLFEQILKFKKQITLNEWSN